MNNGLQNEVNITNALHGLRISQLSDFWRLKIKDLFNTEDESAIVVVRPIPVYVGCKTDLEIQVNNKTLNISVKSGFSPSIHQEQAKYFVEFVNELDLSEKTKKLIAFYLYGDGTVDGTGYKRFGTAAMTKFLRSRIHEANIELSDPQIIKKFVMRCLIKGRHDHKQEIDYIYYGNEKNGVFVSKEDILKYAMNSKSLHYKSIHCGPLIMFRDVRTAKSDDTLIKYAQFKWPSLWKDMCFIEDQNRQIRLF